LSLTSQIPAQQSPPAPGAVKLVLQPRSGWQPIHFGDLWKYRELLWTLALRDIRVRYKQTVLGAAWAIIQPLANTIVFVAFFSGFAPPGISAQVFFFTGLLPWQLFSTSLTNASNSLVGSQQLITKVYFPRLVIPLAAVVTSLIDFAISFAVLVLMMAYYRVPPSPMCLMAPLFVVLAFLAALAVGLWLSAMNVEFRDVRYVVPFLVQFWLFVTPVIYPASHVHTPWKRILLGLNPMSGVVEGFRWCILGTDRPSGMILASVGMVLVLLIGGLYYFRRMERTFADIA
jgi:lipopolysaccharide transport system permease protein